MSWAIISLAACAIATTFVLPSCAQATPAQNSSPVADALEQSAQRFDSTTKRVTNGVPPNTLP